MDDWDARNYDKDIHLRKDIKFPDIAEDKIKDHATKVEAYVSGKISPEELALIPQIEELPKFIPAQILENRVTELAEEGILDLNKTCVFFGKRGTGKTFLLRWILQDPDVRSQFPRIIVMTDTKLNNFWQKYVPEDYIHEGFSPALVNKILDKQEEVVKKWNKLDDEDKLKVNTTLCVVMDDVISNDNIKYCKLFDRIFTAGRHYHIALFITTQYAKGINTVARGNIDFAFVFKQDMRIQMESLADDFFNFFTNRHTAFEILDRFTDKHRTGDEHLALCVAKQKNTNNLYELLTIVKAEDDNGEKLGDEMFQQLGR